MMKIERSTLWLIIFATIASIALMLPEMALAQSIGDMPTISDLQAAAGQKDDKSVEILGLLLGSEELVKNPFKALGPATTLLGSLFFVFNACLFAIGTAYIGYNMISAVAVSANDGEVLGKRMSGVWLPIRMGAGIFGMLPVFSGFSLSQVVMLTAAVLGIGAANYASIEAIDKAAQFNAVIPPPGLTTAGTGKPAMDGEVAEGLFLMYVCVEAGKDSESFWTQVANKISEPKIMKIPTGVTSSGGMFSSSCGEVTVSPYEDAVREDTFWQNRTSFRISSVQYKDINEGGRQVHALRTKALHDLYDKIEPIADNWYKQFKAGKISPYPSDQILGIVQTLNQKEGLAAKAILADLYGGKAKAITESATEQMKEGGWMSVGSWYATFAESNSALQSAAAASDINVDVMSGSRIDDLPRSFVDPFLALASARRQDKAEDECWVPFSAATPTGGCSVGQNVIQGVLGMIGSGSGGGKLVNPIIASKTLGDYMLSMAGTVMAAGPISDQLMRIPPIGRAAAVVAEGASKAAKVVAGDKAARQLKTSDKRGEPTIFGRMLGTVLLALIVLGLIFAVYIPMVPFITWFTALVSYFSSVIEGLIAAQVWAFSHLNSEGDGMGQKTERGYVYLLNMLLRPVLMVMGFFFASGIIVLMGTFLFDQLAAVIANAQGNSMTGPMIIFGTIAVVMLILLTLIQTTFNLIYEIPDRVIGWFGGAMEARMAKEMDSKVEGQMKSASQWGGNMALFGGMKTGR